uniref:Uncharacterized protein KIAA1257 homolog isoform X4 n=1 Tax=Geotrypetes seraphini TaxID=260995 RepID=A0A6P8PLP0_GEOSA|nr:uncharacterized protein KIAA1257 homolog isoform X4 [Geotrypetes seraphini]
MNSEEILKTNGTDSGFTTDTVDSSELQGDPSAPEKRRSKNDLESSLESSKLLQEDYISTQEDVKPESMRGLYMSGMSEQGEGSDIYSESENMMGSSEKTAEGAEEQEPFHLVTLTITIGFCVSNTGKQEQPVRKQKRRTKSPPTAATSKSEGFYHVEYNLLPDSIGPVQADVVMAGAVARLFTEHNDPQCLKPWYNSERMWLSWNQNIELKVTNAFLVNISTHIITMNIWDSKDKVSLKAKQDKLKQTKSFLHEIEELEGEIQNLVTYHRKLFEDSQPKPSFISSMSTDVHHLKETGRNKSSSVNENVAVQERNEIPKAAGEKEGRVALKLDFVPLLAGDTSVTQWIEISSFSIMDAFMTLSVKEPLMSEKQKLELNPLIIRIISATSLPITPLSSQVLQRVYKDLNTFLYQIHLYQPLSCIMKQPLLYIRDMVPFACFQALSRLDYICSSKKLKDIIQEDLLPSAEMITLLSREFGIPLSTEKVLSSEVLPSDSSLLTPGGKESSLQSINVQPDSFNENYLQAKKNIISHKDHIKINIEKAFEKQKIKPKIKTIVAVPPDGMPVHNYGFQSLNSSELAMKLLRQEMAKEPRRRFAYNHYLSGTLDPVDLKTELKKHAAKSKRAWLTPQGFVYPGVKSSIESNQHPGKPHEGRILDLAKKWKENLLHDKPVSDRGPWGWNQRHMDFDLYSKPTDIISVETSYSSHYTEDHFAEDLQKTAEREYIKWLEKIVVDDPRMTFYRCSIEGELTVRGPKASSQQKKLVGLLKDVPVKYSLREPILTLKPITPLAVLERTENTTKAFGPGEDQLHTLTWNGNAIPRYDMEHKKFEKLKGADFKLF